MQPLLEVPDPPNRQPVPTTLHGSTGAWTALLADPTQELTHTLHRGMLHSGARDVSSPTPSTRSPWICRTGRRTYWHWWPAD